MFRYDEFSNIYNEMNLRIKFLIIELDDHSQVLTVILFLSQRLRFLLTPTNDKAIQATAGYHVVRMNGGVVIGEKV